MLILACATALAGPQNNPDLLRALRQSTAPAASAPAQPEAPASSDEAPSPRATAQAAAPKAKAATHGIGNDLKSRIQDAEGLARAGKREEAEKVYLEIIDTVRKRVPDGAGPMVCADNRDTFAKVETLRGPEAKPGVWVDPTYAFALYVLGSFAMKDRDFEKARNHFTSAIQCAPYMPMFYRSLGLCLCQLGEDVASAKAYSVATDLLKGRHRELIDMLTEQRECQIARAREKASSSAAVK